MLAFSGCYYGGGDKERKELGAIRKRWKTLHVRPRVVFLNLFEGHKCGKPEAWKLWFTVHKKQNKPYQGHICLLCVKKT